jgi:7-carboxy-7-deazaguanine synthase
MKNNSNDTLKINEIFYSVQGESSMAGVPCIFIRLTYCNLRCSYCDTEYAFYEGQDMTIEEILRYISRFNCKTVEITGGEPLFQNNVHKLIENLCDRGYFVMLETGGSLPVQNIDKRVKIIMDIKTPSSRMEKKNLYDNIRYLKRTDEIKFVIGNREDYEWSKRIIKRYSIDTYVDTILFSPVFGVLENRELAEWIIEDGLKVRMQIQMHKYIWQPETRGV